MAATPPPPPPPPGPPTFPMAGGPPPKKKKASKAVKLGAIGVLSVLVVGFCAATDDDYEEVDADCVDMNNPLADGSYPIVDDDLCDDDRRTYVGSHGAYGWYYGGVRAGSHIRGGTTLRPSNAQISTRSGKVIQRGGFGSHGSSSGS